MTDFNPYKQYSDDNVLNSNPLGLVIALYEGAIDASVNARACFSVGDIPGRTKSINKVVSILTELTSSLDHAKGGEVSRNLDRLYNYMQRRTLDAHFTQNAGPLEEVERLLGTLLEGWAEARSSFHAGSLFDAPLAHVGLDAMLAVAPYASYGGDYGDFSARQAYSF